MKECLTLFLSLTALVNNNEKNDLNFCVYVFRYLKNGVLCAVENKRISARLGVVDTLMDMLREWNNRDGEVEIISDTYFAISSISKTRKLLSHYRVEH